MRCGGEKLKSETGEYKTIVKEQWGLDIYKYKLTKEKGKPRVEVDKSEGKTRIENETS